MAGIKVGKLNNLFRRTRAWCMGVTVNHCLAGIVTQMRSQFWSGCSNGRAAGCNPVVARQVGSIPTHSTKFCKCQQEKVTL